MLPKTYEVVLARDDNSYRYTFLTSYNTKYIVEYFRVSETVDMNASFFEKNAFLLEFDKEESTQSRRDPLVADTILSTLRDFLLHQKENALIAYYGRKDRISALARKRLFDNWLSRLNKNNEFIILEVDVKSSGLKKVTEDFMTIIFSRKNQKCIDWIASKQSI